MLSIYQLRSLDNVDYNLEVTVLQTIVKIKKGWKNKRTHYSSSKFDTKFSFCIHRSSEIKDPKWIKKSYFISDISADRKVE